MSSRAPWAPWFGIQLVSLPSSPQTAAAARDSIGAGATRWLMNVCVDHDLAAVEQVLLEAARVAEVRDHVGARVLEQQHLVGQRVVEVDDRRERVVVDVDQLDRVLALVRVLGDDDGDRLADEPDLVGRQQRSWSSWRSSGRREMDR